ncbi:hypothetical protein ACFPK1_16805 [Actinomycetospora rhizophila]|uniref:Intracellular septation protein A n=1 Tax=Actinomycetospora rhizophila TaxID=1416876 RepID=A0ABV9ZFY4_9PSEU
MSSLKTLSGFVPWIVFTLTASRLGAGAVGVACLLALVVAVGLIAREMIKGESPKLLEVSAAVVFLALGIVAFAVPGVDAFLAGYGRALAAAALAAIIFATLPVMPFTEQYARESVPREFWHTERFRSINRRISAVWGAVIVGMAVSHAVAGTFDAPGAGAGFRPTDLVFNWVVPGLLIWAAIAFTERAQRAAKTDHAAPLHGAHEATASP